MARAREITRVAARHGFGYAFERRPLRRQPPPESAATIGRHLREMLDELGPTFVKFGQLLSTRPDLVPEDVAAQLRLLQDSVSPFPFEQVRAGCEDRAGRSAGDALCARSIRCRWRRRRSARCTRPSCRAAASSRSRCSARRAERRSSPTSRCSTRLRRTVRKRVKRLQFMDTVGVVDEFARSIRHELDYRIEGRNVELFRRNFADDERIVVPKVYWTYSSQRVLTLEWLEGRRLGELNLPETPMAERRRLALLMARYVARDDLPPRGVPRRSAPGQHLRAARGPAGAGRLRADRQPFRGRHEPPHAPAGGLRQRERRCAAAAAARPGRAVRPRTGGGVSHRAARGLLPLPGRGARRDRSAAGAARGVLADLPDAGAAAVAIRAARQDPGHARVGGHRAVSRLQRVRGGRALRDRAGGPAATRPRRWPSAAAPS